MRRLLKLTFIILISACIFCGYLFTNNTEIAHAAEETVYLGGMPIGIQAKSEYYTVMDFYDVITKNGSYSPAKKAGLEKGDIILAVDGIKPNDIKTMGELFDKTSVEVTLKRKGEILKKIVTVEIDLRENAKKTGMMVKNDLIGIGTVTYFRKNGSFGALGHPVADLYGQSEIYQKGSVYECTIYGYKRAEKDKPGELIGQINTQKPLGEFYSNSLSGILGKFNTLPEPQQEIPIAKQEDVKPGRAQICTTIDGKTPIMYEIEIIKKNEQASEKDKSMLIRVTDKNLLKTTGGILQGMSGSPIIQDGKLIGAVTHVLTSESTIGYGIYIEWMMN